MNGTGQSLPDPLSGATGRSPRGPLAVLQIGVVAASLVSPALARRLTRRMPAGAAHALIAGVLVVGGHATTALAERRRPFRAEWNEARDGDTAVDATYHFLQSPAVLGASGVATAGLSALIVAAVLRGRRLRVWPGRLPLAARLGLALAVSELSHYWWHRIGHGRGWRWHSVHHSSGRLYWLNALRFHVIDSFFDGVIQGVPLTLLNIDTATMLAHNVFAATYGQVQHANVDGASGWFGAVLSTPEMHRWHHSTDPLEGNSNFGAKLSLWDRVFGTYFLPGGRPFDAEIGVGGMGDFPVRYREQLRVPFRWAALTDRPESREVAAGGA